MSKISSETLQEALEEIVKGTQERAKKRKEHKRQRNPDFVETIELQVALKNYDPNKDKRFSGQLQLSFTPRTRFSVAIIGDAKHYELAKTAGFPVYNADDLKKLKKDKKKVKAMAKAHDAFLASASLIKQIPRLVGPGFNKAGKFPTVLNPNDNITDKVNQTKATIKFQLKSKKTLCMGVAIGNAAMPIEDVTQNIHLAANFLASLLPKNWQQVKRLYVKSTFGSAHRIYGFA